MQNIHSVLSPIINITKMQAWTDSSIVLSWLTTDQKFFKIFVTNRIAKIRALLPNCFWSHVSTIENPADPSSRGLLPVALIACSLHWDGPVFLSLPEIDWPVSNFAKIHPGDLPEVKPMSINALAAQKLLAEDYVLHRFSTWSHMQRSLGYALRFVYATFLDQSGVTGSLTLSERNRATMFAVRLTQKLHFSDLFRQLSRNNCIITPPTMAQVAPFLDPKGFIRVGGRLKNSLLCEEAKYPLLLPKSSHLTALIIRHYHLTFLHAGPKLIISMIRQKFWIVSARDAIRRSIFACVTCTRYKARHPTPIMGNLPVSRVQNHRVFSQIGMDYGGPYLVKECKRRNTKTTKVYIALFICMATKAVHIDIVSDLTASAFLAAFDRFVARRGIPDSVFSDNGTNYVGAARQLKLLFQNEGTQNLISTRFPCKWHFNPPAAPHFGGLWEAAIKSVKFHLKRVIGTQLLTYEEFQTLTTRVEGVLNSRPLTPASTDPHDLEALTPGHFIIGKPILSIPEVDITATPINRLTRWQLIKQLHQSFWKRWTREYLTTLQGRQKWSKPDTNLKIGDMVLVDAPALQPSDWRMGRVTMVHPGQDEIVRVVTVRTQDGILKRPVIKLVRLPVSSSIHTNSNS